MPLGNSSLIKAKAPLVVSVSLRKPPGNIARTQLLVRRSVVLAEEQIVQVPVSEKEFVKLGAVITVIT